MNINFAGVLLNTDISEVGPADGLVAWYPLKGDTKDYAMGRNDGTNNGATATVRGYEFDGINDYIEIPRISLDKVGFSISGWLYVTSFTASLNRAASVTFLSSSLSDFYSYISFYDGQTRMEFDGNSTPLEGPAATSGVVQGSWFHFTVSVLNAVPSVYINGTLRNIWPTSTANYTVDYIGREPGADNYPGYFDGKISDVRFYNRALSDQEIAVLYEMTDPTINTRMKKTQNTLYVKGQFQET